MSEFIKQIHSLSGVTEVLIIKPSDYASVDQWEENGINYKKISLRKQKYNMQTEGSIEHAVSLHYAIDLAVNPYLLLTDPDIIFFEDITKFYKDLMDENNLDCIGISHQNSIESAARFFPCVTNMLVKKKSLPDSEFLKNQLNITNVFNYKQYMEAKKDGNYIAYPANGMYLLPGYMNLPFPNPTGNFDTGCALWMWSDIVKWKWLSFQTMNCHEYYSIYNRGNVKVKINQKKLLYHCTHSVTLKEKRKLFKEIINASTNGLRA
jgi:hypothetical protein